LFASRGQGINLLSAILQPLVFFEDRQYYPFLSH